MNLKYKPGKQNTNADGLSRYPVCTLNQTELTKDQKLRILKEMHSDLVGAEPFKGSRVTEVRHTSGAQNFPETSK
jgi:hypothetical protein